MTDDYPRRVEQLERDAAVMQDRQTRYEATQTLILTKLDLIQRDISASRELLATGYVTHNAMQLRNTEVDARFTKIESQVDSHVKWLVGTLTTAVLSIALAAAGASGKL